MAARWAHCLLESIEAISLGIEGKRGLWLALGTLASRLPELGLAHYGRLVQRAEQQRKRLEPYRRQAAVDAIANIEKGA
jgi:hypothetical protein